jgi:hypothetical protein
MSRMLASAIALLSARDPSCTILVSDFFTLFTMIKAGKKLSI